MFIYGPDKGDRPVFVELKSTKYKFLFQASIWLFITYVRRYPFFISLKTLLIIQNQLYIHHIIFQGILNSF